MFDRVKSIILGAAAALFMAGAVQAAPVNFQAGNVAASLSGSCDGFCNVLVLGLPQSGIIRTVDDGSPLDLNAIAFPGVPPRDLTGDSFTVLASIALDVGGTVYNFAAQGLMTDWTVGALGGFRSGTLSWTQQPVIPQGSPLSVVFNDALEVGPFGVRFSTLTISAVPSVVPLPAGVVLLLTGLLGLVGLSRRRKAVA